MSFLILHSESVFFMIAMATLLEVGCDAARAQETKLLENFDIDLHVVDSSEAGFGGGDVCGYWC